MKQGGEGSRSRSVLRGDVVRSSRRGCVTSRSTSPTKGEDELRDTLTRSTNSGAPAATATTTSRCRRRAIGMLVAQIAPRRAAEGWARLIIEKPFGHDLESVRDLKRQLQQDFAENAGVPHRRLPRQGDGVVHAGAVASQRHLRADLEPAVSFQSMSRSTVAQSIGIEGCAGYDEQAGAIREIFQNDPAAALLRTAMELLFDFTADSVRNEKVRGAEGAPHAGAEARPGVGRTGWGSRRGRGRARGYCEEARGCAELDQPHVCRREAVGIRVRTKK